MSDAFKTQTITRNGLTFRADFFDDESPDLSYLGTLTDREPAPPYYDRGFSALVVGVGPDERRKLRDARGRISYADDSMATPPRREYRYIAGFQSPDSAKACVQDAERLLDYENGWRCIGIRVALVVNGEDIAESMGLWGIESDSGDDYFQEVIGDEVDSIDTRAALLAYAEKSAEAAALARGLLATIPA